jgi:hypothetical protein
MSNVFASSDPQETVICAVCKGEFTADGDKFPVWALPVFSSGNLAAYEMVCFSCGADENRD